MERLTHAWAEMSIAGVTLSRVGMSRMISALQFKYSTKKKWRRIEAIKQRVLLVLSSYVNNLISNRIFFHRHFLFFFPDSLSADWRSALLMLLTYLALSTGFSDPIINQHHNLYSVSEALKLGRKRARGAKSGKTIKQKWIWRSQL